MPRVQITLQDGSKKTLQFANDYTEADIDEAASYYNSQLKQQSNNVQKVEGGTITDNGQDKLPSVKLDLPQEQPTKLYGQVMYNESPNPVRNAIRQAGRSTARALLPEKAENWFLGSKKDEQYLKTHNDGNTLSYNDASKLYKQGVLTQDDFLKSVQEREKLDRLRADAEYRDVRNKNIGKGTIDIGTAAIPLGGGGKVALKGANMLNPYLGKRIASGVASGAVAGGKYGLAHGALTGVVDEDVNPVTAALTEGALNTLIGGTIGLAGEKVAQGLNPTGRNQHPVSEINPNNIINDTTKNFNPSGKNNLFGGEVEQVEGLLPEIKQSKLTQTMADRGTLPEEFKNLSPEYQVLHNADIANQATEALNTNPNKVLGELQQKAFNKESELSALDFEMARQTISKLYQEGRTEEALALTEQISQKASKAGQSVQALSLWSKTTPEGAVRYAQKIISDYNKKAKVKLPLLSENQANEIMELAQNTQTTEIGTRENDIANQLLLKYFKELVPASAGSKLRTLQNISLLLNPKTFLRNIGGNSIFAAMDTGVSKPIAAGLDSIASAFTGKKTRVNPQIGDYLQGLKQGFKEGVEDVNLGINTRDKIGSRFNLNDRTSFDNVPGLNQLEKALNYSLQVPDRMFYQAAYNESIANQMRAAGISEPTADIIRNATNEALEAVFQNNGALGNMTLKMRQGANELLNVNGYGLGDAFIPYAQTPANVAQQGINYSPLGLVKGIQSALSGNQRQATMDFARAITGSGLMGVGALGAYNGVFNPNIDNTRTRKNYEALGIRPNTINLGDYNVSYNQLQPLAAPISGGAAIIDVLNGDTMQGIDRSLGSIIDLGMLQSANKFMADLNDEGLGTATTNLVASIPSRFVPTGLKQITDLTDNWQRDTYDKNPLKQGLNQAIAKVPGLNRTLPIKYDVTGQPMKKYETEGLQRIFDATTNPVFVNKNKKDETLQELINLAETQGDNSILLPVASKRVQFKDLQGNPVVKNLNARERNEYQKQLGYLNKEVLDTITKTNLYKSLDAEDKINLISTTQRYIKGYVDEQLFDKPNAQKQKLIKSLLQTDKDKIIKEILGTYKNEILPLQVKKIYDDNF